MPKVSVIIPTYNYGKYIEKAIDSVLAQTYRDFEIIVVDDGSTDDTREIIEDRYKDKVRYFYQENKGAPVARNFGLRKAEGEFITFLDADDWLMPNSLATRLSYLRKHPEYDWVYGNWDVVDATGSLIGTADQFFLPPPQERSGDIFPILLRGSNPFTPLTVLMKRGDLLSVGGFRDGLEASQDYELWLRFSRGRKIGFIDQCLAVQRLHRSHISSQAEKRYTVELKLIREYMNDPEGREILAPIHANRVSNVHNYLAGIHALSGKYRSAIWSCIKSAWVKPIQLTSYKFLWYILTRSNRKLKSVMENKTMSMIEDSIADTNSEYN